MAPVVKAITGNEKSWVDFMMRFELGLEEPQPKRARISALTIAVSYIVGGLIPLAPYILLSDVQKGLYYSVGVTLLALAVFGWVKGTLHRDQSVQGRAANRRDRRACGYGGVSDCQAHQLERWKNALTQRTQKAQRKSSRVLGFQIPVNEISRLRWILPTLNLEIGVPGFRTSIRSHSGGKAAALTRSTLR